MPPGRRGRFPGQFQAVQRRHRRGHVRGVGALLAARRVIRPRPRGGPAARPASPALAPPRRPCRGTPPARCAVGQDRVCGRSSPRSGRRTGYAVSMQPAAWPEPDPLIASAIAAKYRGKRPRPLAVQVRDRLGQWLADEEFAALFGIRGRPGWPPSRLALVTVLQRAENLCDARPPPERCLGGSRAAFAARGDEDGRRPGDGQQAGGPQYLEGARPVRGVRVAGVP
jgi:hypothetical protein